MHLHGHTQSHQSNKDHILGKIDTNVNFFFI